MDIGSGNKYPSAALSNFAPHPFVFDGVECASFEGFIQSVKFKNPDMQVHVCSLVGIRAKMKGKGKKWWREQKLFWKDEVIDRHSDRYQELLDDAFNALATNEGFRKALLATKDANLTHSIGKSDAHRTVLTEREFIQRLNRLRSEIKAGLR